MNLKNKIGTYLIIFVSGIALGFIGYCGIDRNKDEEIIIIHDTIKIMKEPVTIIDSNPKPSYVGNSYIGKIFVNTRDTIYLKDTLDYKNLYEKLYIYADTLLRERFYETIKEDSIIKITIKDTVLGLKTWNSFTYYIKPVIYKKTIEVNSNKPLFIYGNLGYDLKQKTPTVGVDFTYNKFIFGYNGNGNNINSFKIGYLLYKK